MKQAKNLFFLFNLSISSVGFSTTTPTKRKPIPSRYGTPDKTHKYSFWEKETRKAAKNEGQFTGDGKKAFNNLKRYPEGTKTLAPDSVRELAIKTIARGIASDLSTCVFVSPIKKPRKKKSKRKKIAFKTHSSLASSRGSSKVDRLIPFSGPKTYPLNAILLIRYLQDYIKYLMSVEESLWDKKGFQKFIRKEEKARSESPLSNNKRTPTQINLKKK